MNISTLSSVVFWPCDISFAADPYPDAFDLCQAGLTFNTEVNDDRVRIRPHYFHKLESSDTIKVAIFDNTTHVIKLLLLDEDGTVLDSADFAPVDATNYQVAQAPSLVGYEATKVMFAIYDENDGKIYGISDYHYIRESIAARIASVLITHGNAGFDYDYAHKTLSFQVRMPGVFNEGVPAEEIEVDDTIDTRYLLSSEVKKLRTLKVFPVPSHIHHQLSVILKCSSLSIVSKSWIQEEGYDVTRVAEGYQYLKGRVNLTEQGSTIRNVYKA